jgi:LysM repeat protein
MFGSPALLTYEEQVTAAPAVIAKASAPVTYQYEQTERIYSVKKGDNLGKIANQNKCSVSDLRVWNNIKGSLLQIGQQLVIKEKKLVNEYSLKGLDDNQPTATSKPLGSPAVETKTQDIRLHKVERGESLWSIAMKNNLKLQDILEANNMKASQKIEPGMQLILPRK